MQHNIFKRLVSTFIAAAMIMSSVPAISVSASETVCTHNMTHITAKQATCVNSGNVEYWHCDACNKNFSDKNGVNELAAVKKTIGVDADYDVSSWKKEENVNITSSDGEALKAFDLYSVNMPVHSLSGSKSITFKSGPGQLKLATTVEQGNIQYGKFTITITVNDVQKKYYDYTVKPPCNGTYSLNTLELTEAENTIVITCNKTGAITDWGDAQGRLFHVALLNTKDNLTQHQLVFHRDYDCMKGGHEDYYHCELCGVYMPKNTPETDDNNIDAPIVKPATGSHNDSDNDGLCDADDYIMFEPDAEGWYIISNGGLFNTFALIYNNGNTSAKAKLASDIDLSSSAFTSVGTDSNPFSGTFDGCGYTITVNQSGSKDVAPFGKIGNCTIKNLKTTGTINTTNQFAAGIAMQNIGGTTANIENCISDIDIVSSINGDGTHGGIIGVADGNVNINNCAFTGSIKGSSTNNCGGFVGWARGSVSINNSYVAATFDISASGGNTFSRNPNNAALTNCYYLNPLNETPGGATQVTAEQLSRGEACYWLNNSVSDGTQAWYQNVDDGSADSLPIPDNSHNTVYSGYINCTEISYSNIIDKVSETPLAHSFTENVDENNHKCAYCDATEAHSFEASGCSKTCSICNATLYEHLSPLKNIPASDKLTCLNSVIMGHWHCDICDKYFFDENGKKEWSGNIEDMTQKKAVDIEYDDNSWTKEENKEISLSNGEKITALDLYSRDMPEKPYTGSRSITIKSGPGQLKLATTVGQESIIDTLFTITITVNGEQKKYYDYTTYPCRNYSEDTLELTEHENIIVVTCNKTKEGTWYNTGKLFQVALLNTKDTITQHELVFHRDYDCMTGGHEDYYQCAMCGAYKTTNTPETDEDIIPAPIEKAATGSHNDGDNDGFCDACDYLMSAPDGGYYVISNIYQFKVFAEAVNNGNTSANAKLADDIDLSSTTFTAIGTTDNPFSGTFDGCGYTITVNQSYSEDVAPFGRIGNCTIKNLKTAGTINTYTKFAAGIAMQNVKETTANIENCISDIDIVSSIYGDGTHGGIIGVADGTVNINNCAFTGSIKGSDTNKCGGLVGWAGGSVSINNSYVSAAYGIDTSGCNTFVRNQGNAALTNCYYLNPLNETPSGTTKVTEEQLAGGEVCYNLNGDQSNIIWYQTLGRDTTPQLSGKTVCFDENSTTQKYYNELIKGDVDDSGAVDKVDAAIVLKYISGIDTTLSAEQLELADANGDKAVNIKDAIAILNTDTAA